MKPILSNLSLSVGIAMLLAGCVSDAPPARSARADLSGATGGLMAHAEAVEVDGGVRVHIRAAGLQPGTYAVHVHENGVCDAANGFQGAGGHWNPTGRQHGSENPQGQHLGDLPNLLVAANGEGTIAYVIRGARFAGEATALMAPARAVVVHQRADDYRTDPSGNSGDRIACGVLGEAAHGSGHAAAAGHSNSH
jgi:Cu-Zn family superoxide dismutase